jgi:hypothetical protein
LTEARAIAFAEEHAALLMAEEEGMEGMWDWISNDGKTASAQSFPSKEAAARDALVTLGILPPPAPQIEVPVTREELMSIIRSRGYQTGATGGSWTLNPCPAGSEESYAWDIEWRRGKGLPCPDASERHPMSDVQLTVSIPVSERQRLADLSRISRQPEMPDPVQGGDGLWRFFDQPKDSVLWFAVFYEKEAACKAWSILHPTKG